MCGEVYTKVEGAALFSRADLAIAQLVSPRESSREETVRVPSTVNVCGVLYAVVGGGCSNRITELNDATSVVVVGGGGGSGGFVLFFVALT